MSGAPPGIIGMFESRRIRSTCRVTPVFRRIELSWVRTVVIWTPKSPAISTNFLPARSATASRLSAGDNLKNSANSPFGRSFLVRVAKYDQCQGASIESQIGAERRHVQHVRRVTI